MPTSTPVTGAAPGVMPPQVLGGPLWWFAVALYALAVALAVYVLFDAQRPLRRERLAELPEPGWLYAGFSGTFLVFVVGVWLPLVPRVVSIVPVVLAPFSLALSFAYLLRVTFPKPMAPRAADAEPSDDRWANETDHEDRP